MTFWGYVSKDQATGLEAKTRQGMSGKVRATK